jgi:hypothetical protein
LISVKGLEVLCPILETELGRGLDAGRRVIRDPSAPAKTPTPPTLNRRPHMRFTVLIGMLLVSTGLALADPSESTEIGVSEVQALGTLNGQALACRQYPASNEAKALMIRYAPKTRRYGTLFESATNTAFVAAAKEAVPCPTEADLVARLAESATALQAVFPERSEPDRSDRDQPELDPSNPDESKPVQSIDEGGS